MRRGQLVEVNKILIPGTSTWVSGYEYVRREPSGAHIVRQLKGVFAGLESRYNKWSVRPLTCKSCSGQKFHRCRGGDKLCRHCSSCGAMPFKDPRRLRKNDAYSPFPVDDDQLRIGTAIEAKEHGMTQAMAEKTAREHIAEDSQYYTKLAKMEKGAAMWGWDKLFTF